MSRCDNCRYQDDTEFDACHICNNEQDMFRPKKTNGDRIRAMTDDELAKLLVHNPWMREESAYNWLRKEAEE